MKGVHDRVEDAPRVTCEWEYDHADDAWDGTCGIKWQMESSPKENGMHYCPRCGGKLRQLSRARRT